MAPSVPRFAVLEIDLGSTDPDPWALLDVTFTDPDGTSRTVPAFIGVGDRWRVRYSSAVTGRHVWRAGDLSGELEITARAESGTRLSHGPLVVSTDRRHLEHADGTPFLWLADTWWHGFVDVKSTDQEFAALAAQRSEQGYSVIQIVAGLPCEAGPFDAAVRSRSGWAWQEGFEGINLAWWNDADARFQSLIDADLVPCLLGSWGYHFTLMDDRQMARHWREMIARWGAHPVVWCISGEPPLIWYDDLAALRTDVVWLKDTGDDSAASRSEWGIEVTGPAGEILVAQLVAFNRTAHAVREMEPFGRLVTTHTVPGMGPWQILDDPDLVDFWFLQTGHSGHASIEPTLAALTEALEHEPRKPVINGEVNYEGISGSSWQDIQRFLFWSHLLSGAAGHSYGAHGLWAFNTPEFPGQYSGLAPTWKEAAQFPGGHQLGLARKILLDYPWHEMVPVPDPAAPGDSTPFRLYTATLPDGRRLTYFPSMAMKKGRDGLRLTDLDDRQWTARCINLTTGIAQPSLAIDRSPDGTGTVEAGALWPMPGWDDWLVEVSPMD